MSSEEETLSKSEKRGLFSRWRRKNKTEVSSQPFAPRPEGEEQEVGDVADLALEIDAPEAGSANVLSTGDEAEKTDLLPEEPLIEAAVEVAVEAAADRRTVDREIKLESQIELESAKPLLDVSASKTQDKPAKKKKAGIFSRALSRTSEGLGSLFLGRKSIDDDLLDELETVLLMADVGVELTTEIITELTSRVKRGELSDSVALKAELRRVLFDIVSPCEEPLDVTGNKLFVLLVVGVNGVGKTTTIGKLAQRFQREGRSVMLAAGDTFRAAAVEQLQVWGERNQVPVIAQHTGADSASVIYDAIVSAKAKGVDILIADTAGRLHTKTNLMDELEKVKRVMSKLDEAAPHEILLVLDAGTGQNALNQMKEFNQAVGVTGLALTKLDGTAKGGVVFALCRGFGVPLRYVGLGEGVDDLQVFRAGEYVRALLSETDDVSHDRVR